MNREQLMSVLLAPHVTEKTSLAMQNHNQYTFRVRREATKTDIKQAVELMFDVKVKGVQVVNEPGKTRRFGSTIGPHAGLEEGLREPGRPARRSTTKPAPRPKGRSMALIKLKPTSPGQRSVIKVDRSHLHKGGPLEPLTAHQNKTGARNHFGRITTRHQGGGSRQKYRLIDFKRDKDGIAGRGRAARVRSEPHRHIALVKYADGERRYILAPKGMQPGDEVRSGADSPIKSGNAMSLRHIPVGSIVHNVELKPGRGGQLARSAGASVQFTSREGIYAFLRLKSGETRKVHIDCRATLGEVGNDEHNLRSYGKAGAKRWRGIRPTVRGLAMNPVDHPHGGGEGKSGQGNPHPVSPWGQNTKG